MNKDKNIRVIKKMHQSNGMNFGKKMEIDFEDYICPKCKKPCKDVANIANDSRTAMIFYYAKCLKCNKEYWSTENGV